jgi:hypothetical protein
MNLNKLFKYCLIAGLFSTQPIFSQPSNLNKTSSVAQALGRQKTDFQIAEGQMEGAKDTNGWSCILTVGNIPPYSTETPLACKIFITNILSTNIMCWAGIYGPTYSRIQLFDSNGAQVRKTEMGKGIWNRSNDQEIKEMVKERFQSWVRGQSRTDGFIPVGPGQTACIDFSIPDFFELKQPGEYTLKVRTCLILRIGGEKGDPDLKIIRLPEVVAPVRITSPQ